MTEARVPVVDTSVPNMARMYDYALGGKDNFAADREAVEKLFSMSPENKYVPLANRRFLGRAVRYVAEQGIDQYLDLGAGLPARAMSTRSPTSCGREHAWSTWTTTRW